MLTLSSGDLAELTVRVVVVSGFRLAKVDDAGLEVVVVVVGRGFAGAVVFGLASPAALSVVGETFVAEVTLKCKEIQIKEPGKLFLAAVKMPDTWQNS